MQTNEERKELLRNLNIMDDVFFQKISEDQEVCEEILQVILQKPNLKVVEAQTQRFLRNIGAHSVILDLVCQDEDGSHINVEVQKSRDKDEDYVKRIRFNVSNIDTTFTERGLIYKKLPDIYAVFLSRLDVFEEGKTVYHLDMYIRETGMPVNDGIHRIFANCAVDDGSDIAELMQYFKNTKGGNSKFPKLSDRVKYFKESQEGENSMSQTFEEYVQKRIDEHDKEMAEKIAEHDKEIAEKTAKSLLQNGASPELVKKSIPELSPDDIEKLSKQLALAK